jgi:7-keto-8-aminopelargonate synthetase-like enzyme
MTRTLSDTHLALIDAEETAVSELLTGARDFTCHDALVSRSLLDAVRAAREEIVTADRVEYEAEKSAFIQRHGRRVY